MNYKLIIDIDAFKDIQETIQTKKQINSLKKDPYIFSLKYNEIRCRKIEKFPFLIHYQVDEILKTITVFAVFHTSRSPKIWERKDK